MKIINVNNLKIIVRNQSDEAVVKEVFHNNDYKLSNNDFDSVDTVIDVGGHIGTFSMLSAQKNKKVIAFEPSHNYDIFCQNIALNRIPNVTIHKLGVVRGDIKESIMHIGRTPARNSLITSEFNGDKSSLKIKCININDVMGLSDSNKILLKIDIEGDEENIINAITEENLSKIKIIVAELHFFKEYKWNEVNYVNLQKKLTELNYVVKEVKRRKLPDNSVMFVIMRAIKNES